MWRRANQLFLGVLDANQLIEKITAGGEKIQGYSGEIQEVQTSRHEAPVLSRLPHGPLCTSTQNVAHQRLGHAHTATGL